MPLAEIIRSEPALLETLLNLNNSLLLILLGRDGVIEECNDAFVALLHLTEKPVGRRIREFIESVAGKPLGALPATTFVPDNGVLMRLRQDETLLRAYLYKVENRRLLACLVQKGAEREDLDFMTGLNTELANLSRQLREKSGALVRANKEKAAVIEELRQAMNEIKTLRKMIPTCSNCGKFRDEKGSWMPVQDYIQAHTDSKFTHGFCDECLRKLFPDEAEAIIQDLKR